MHALRLRAPGAFEIVGDAAPPEPAPGQVSVRLSAAGICGSDLPKFRTTVDPRSGRVGFPVHECVGRVAAACGDLDAGTRVLAIPVDDRGLAETYVADLNATHAIGADHLTDEQATLIQPLATVLHATARLGDVAGARVAVLGLGPIGLLCAHVLHHAGAEVVGADPVDRGEVAARLGLAGVLRDASAAWPTSRFAGDPVDICVEAVGHQQRTLRDAVALTRRGGTVLAMGVPDDAEYAVPYQTFFRKNLTLTASVTPPWRQVLGPAEDYLCEHLPALSRLLTHTFSVTDATVAYHTYAHPAPGRLKVVLSTAGGWRPTT
jgi:L-iditol 2-dehydrogenase